MESIKKYLLLIITFIILNSQVFASVGGVWTKERANRWYENISWLRGCNFIPSTAINPIEMWQAETFDTITIDRELGYAEKLGYNSVRVYFHYIVWKNDAEGFKQRIDKFLSIANSHGISVMPIFFDDVWQKEPKAGKQLDAIPGVHNSQWSTSPGHSMVKDTTSFPLLKNYVKDIMGYFAYDKRIVFWDLYNEAGNGKLKEQSIPLLKAVFRWARQVNPSQPITSGIWFKNKKINDIILDNSDIITFHNYLKAKKVKKYIQQLKSYGRPLICTEWLRRKVDNNFENLFGYFYQEKVGAYNWGLVSGKTQTIFSWFTTIIKPCTRKWNNGREPKVWFHDILRKDGTPYRQNEIIIIKEISTKADNEAIQPHKILNLKYTVRKSVFGQTSDGKDVEIYTLTNSKGMILKVMNYGATVVSIIVPDKYKHPIDVALGHDTFSKYLSNNPYLGATVGRYANRIANGTFTLYGTKYKLAVNNGKNHLHGGNKGFDKVLWDAEVVEVNDNVGVCFYYTSKHKEEGYPGELQCAVSYFVRENNEMQILYKASTNSPTPVNLSNHTYFNLLGNGNGDILNHELTIFAYAITPIDETLIPTGELLKVEGTPFDFTSPTKIGERINNDNQQLKFGLGYDHNFVLNKKEKKLTFAARLYEPTTGIEMELYTTELGLQFYTGNFLDGSIIGKQGKVYKYRSGLCLEPHYFPDSPNKPDFPDCILKPGIPYEQKSIYRFITR